MAKKKSSSGPWIVGATAAVVLLCLFGCLFAVVLFNQGKQGGQGSNAVAVPDTDPSNATLTLAYSPEKAALITDLVDRFNAQKLRTDDRTPMEVQLLEDRKSVV